MSSVLDHDSLEQSPLADLHLIANELGVDGFRRLRKADLIEAIIARQSGAEPAQAEEPDEPAVAAAEPAPPRRRSRAKAGPVAEPEPEPETEPDEEGETDEDAP